MRAKSKRFQPIIVAAQLQERKAAERMAGMLQRQQREAERLAQLGSYLEEYLARMPSSAAHPPVSVAQLYNQRRFINQLETAVQQQQERLDRFQDEIVPYKQAWQQAMLSVKQLEKLRERYQRLEREAHERSEQRAMDELAQRQRKDAYIYE